MITVIIMDLFCCASILLLNNPNLIFSITVFATTFQKINNCQRLLHINVLDYLFFPSGQVMAQADTNVVTKLQKAILNIFSYPRGWGSFSELNQTFFHLFPSKEGKEFLKTHSNLLDEHMFKSANIYFDSEAPFQLEDIVISGSCSEGIQKINLQTNSMSDIDFMLTLKNIKVTEEDQKIGNLTVKEDTPFVNLLLTDEDLVEMWTDFLETSSNTTHERSIKLSSMKLKERFRKKYISNGPIFLPLAKEDVENISEGPSLAVCSYVPGNEGADNQYQAQFLPFAVDEMDLVLAIKCDGWPLCAQEWLSRSRCWPSQDVVQKIIEGGFHIVCKSSCEGDFRLSYSNAEKLLIKNLNDLQHKTYRAFKSFVNHYKNEWSSTVKKIICSYHLKTIFLWYCEKSDPRDWTEERVVDHLLSLIDDLTFALRERNLPMYFMPKYNLMEQIEDSGTEVVEKIASVRFNVDLITEGIISEEPNTEDWVNFLFRFLLPECIQLFQKCFEKGSFDPNDLLQFHQYIMAECDKFWINATGSIPTRNDVQGERAANILLESFTKFYESVNDDIMKLPKKAD